MPAQVLIKQSAFGSSKLGWTFNYFIDWCGTKWYSNVIHKLEDYVVTNEEFLDAIFLDDAPRVHVTDFSYDPLDIPKEKHLISWAGKAFSDYKFRVETNEYFTISIFNPDENGKSRRRKDLFIKTPVIILDDVKEKLILEEVERLPSPSYIMETSPGSEQWGYILSEPCTERYMVENLLDGLIKKGLAPVGPITEEFPEGEPPRDPGMKGVTRYVRLPGGYNTKKSKMVNGKPFKCRLTLWQPFNTVRIEDLASPFDIDLESNRNDYDVDYEKCGIEGHPLLKAGLNLQASTERGKIDVTCPWVENHTDSVDDGAAIFVNGDGGFKCHHGNCDDKDLGSLLKHIEQNKPGFTDDYELWKFRRTLGGTLKTSDDPIIEPPPTEAKESKHAEPAHIEETLDRLNHMTPGVLKRELAAGFLQLIDNFKEIDKLHYHQEVCDIMKWSKVDFGKIMKDLRESWYEKKDNGFYDGFVWSKEQNQFYEQRTGIFYKAEAFQNSFSHIDVDVKKNALVNGMCENVDKLDFCPKMPKIFVKEGVKYFNTWNDIHERKGIKGDCQKWLNHWDVLGWCEHRKHMLQWMAFTILYPEQKINHILLLGGKEGVGKDLLLTPFLNAMGRYSRVENGSALLNGFSSYLLNTKHLHFNETEVGDMKSAEQVSSKLKPLATAPPNKIPVDQKYLIPISIQNIVNVSMTTNSLMPIKLNGTSRRYYAIWSLLEILDKDQDVKPEWKKYFHDLWNWMREGGMDHCIYYLRNCVDLSDFDPRATPKMTEFLRDITESSKSAAQQTIEAFIEHRVGSFANDILLSTEACSTLKGGLAGSDAYMYADPNWFTPSKVGRVMRDIQGCVKLRTRRDGCEIRPWTIRNKELYEKMTERELYDCYDKQRRK